MVGGPALSVIVVTYNSCAFIDACLEAIPAAAAGIGVEIHVVDNASTDGTAEHVQQRHPGVRVTAMPRNVGFARANNWGLAAAGADAVVLLNPDTRPAPGSLARLVEFLAATPDAAAAAPALRNPDGTDQRTARAFPTPAAALFGRRSPLTRLVPRNRWSQRYLAVAPADAAAPYPVDWVSGACLMIRRPVVDDVGPLDPGFFMYWEDADWCRRIQSAGRSVWCVPDATVVHDEGSCGSRTSVASVRRFHYGAYRFFAKHHLAGARRVLRPAAAAVLILRGAAVVVGATVTKLLAAGRPAALQTNGASDAR